MAKPKERINKKTGKTEYSARYYFFSNGKKHDSNTAWFPTVKEAEQEAARLKKEKELGDQTNTLQRRDKKVITAFEEFIAEKEKEATKKTLGNTSSANSTWRRAKTIRAKYMPAEIQETKTKDISVAMFRDWLLYINMYDLAGAYTRSLKSTISLFNQWMRDNGYYVTENLDLEIDIALQRMKLKPRKYKNRQDLGERNVLTITDIERICNFYYDKGIEDFKNFYYYTLYYVLFYSGMRVEELIALQWKNIHLEPYLKQIEIKNAINQRETRENVNARIAAEVYHTKNLTSIRTIPIFDFYYELLIDYKNSYKYQYNLSNAEIEECFVFPRLSTGPHDYQASDRPTLVLKEALHALGLKNSDCQMFRHSCATFLILPEPEGLGFSESEVIDYFGHTDTEMLKQIYAQINRQQKAKRMAITFSKYYTPAPNEQQTAENNTQIRLIQRLKGDNEAEKRRSRTKRITAQVAAAVSRRQGTYYYLKKDAEIIDELRPNYEKLIKFVEE